MTPTQLRAFVAVVRLGSVKLAAADLDVSEAAVSLHVGHLRKELGDQLFVRTGSGLAFTPGGLRLASRAAEMLGLQDRTIEEVSQAGRGRRLLRLAVTALFAEHCAPGLIDLFAERAHDLDVELSNHPTASFQRLLQTRAVDAVIGPRPGTLDPSITGTHFLNYQVVAVAGPDHPMSKVQPGAAELRDQTWLLGPSAVTDRAAGGSGTDRGVVPGLLRKLNVPEERQRIFQSHYAAIDEAKRGNGVALALSFAVASDLASGDLRRVGAPWLVGQGGWSVLTLAQNATPAAEELARFVSTPRATRAMLKGTGVTVGRFTPSIHVTLWS